MSDRKRQRPMFGVATRNGRQVHINSFHMMPTPYPLGNENETVESNVLAEIDRHYPGCQSTIAGLQLAVGNFMCIASLTSTYVVDPDCRSLLLLCWFVSNPNRPIRDLVLEGLSQVNWDEAADESAVI